MHIKGMVAVSRNSYRDKQLRSVVYLATCCKEAGKFLYYQGISKLMVCTSEELSGLKFKVIGSIRAR